MKRLIIILIAFFCVGKIQAQQLPQITQYMINNYTINPAVSSMYDYYQVRTSIRNQWVGIAESPRTTILSIYGKKKQQVGLGGMVFSDVTGPTSRIGGSFSYAYSFAIYNDVKLSLALAGGFTQFKIIKSGISVEYQQDPLMSGGDVVRTLPDATFGINFFNKLWYFGISIPQLLSSELDLMDDNFAKIYDNTSINGKLERHIYVLGLYKHFLNSELLLEPNFLFRHVAGSKGQLDLGVRAEYKSKLWGGINYKINNSISPLGFLSGYNINDRFNIGYSFGLPSSSTSVYQSGSHEFMLGIKFTN